MKCWEVINDELIFHDECTRAIIAVFFAFMLYTIFIIGYVSADMAAVFKEECIDSCKSDISNKHLKIITWALFVVYVLSGILIIIYLVNTTKDYGTLALISGLLLCFGIILHIGCIGLLYKIKISKSALYYHLCAAAIPPFLCIMSLRNKLLNPIDT